LSLLLLAFWKNLIILLRHRDYNKTTAFPVLQFNACFTARLHWQGENINC